MSELSVLATPRKRRRFTAAFKAKVVEACQQPGASVAGVALEHSLNANLVHKWIRDARRRKPGGDTPPFVPLPMASPLAPAANQHQETECIRLTIPHSRGPVTVEWPVSAAESCRTMLRDLLS